MDFLDDKHLQSLLYWLQFISAGAYIFSRSTVTYCVIEGKGVVDFTRITFGRRHLSIHLMKFSISFSYWFLLIFFFNYFCWQSPSVRVYQPNSTRAKTFFSLVYSLNYPVRSIGPLKRKLYFPWEFFLSSGDDTFFSTSIELFKCCSMLLFVYSSLTHVSAKDVSIRRKKKKNPSEPFFKLKGKEISLRLTSGTQWYPCLWQIGCRDSRLAKCYLFPCIGHIKEPARVNFFYLRNRKTLWFYCRDWEFNEIVSHVPCRKFAINNCGSDSIEFFFSNDAIQSKEKVRAVISIKLFQSIDAKKFPKS